MSFFKFIRDSFKFSLFLFLFLFIFSSSRSYSVLNIEARGSYASVPSGVIDLVDHNFDTGLGLGFDIVRIQSWLMWQFRVEFNIQLFYYEGLDLRSNFPLLFGNRLLFGGGLLPKWFIPFLDVGYILRIKRDIVAGEIELLTHSLLIGFGVQFFPVNFFYIDFNGRAYLFDMNYFTGGMSIGFRL